VIHILERIFQVTIFVIAGFMVVGGGFFWREPLANSFTRSVTYTLYRRLPVAPVGPRFCPILDGGSYGLVLPCDFKPPFVWWLQHRLD
jgi:hypothetical protein